MASKTFREWMNEEVLRTLKTKRGFVREGLVPSEVALEIFNLHKKSRSFERRGFIISVQLQVHVDRGLKRLAKLGLAEEIHVAQMGMLRTAGRVWRAVNPMDAAAKQASK